MAATSYTDEQMGLILQLQNLIHALANSQDSLDLDLFGSLWRQDGKCSFDLSRHLPDYKPAEYSSVEIVEAARMALSGFEGTQHALTNMVVQFDENDSRRATVRNNITAYHYLDLQDGKGTFTTMRGTWEIRLERAGAGEGVPQHLQKIHGPMGDWVISGIEVARNIPLEGRPELYRLAKERAHQGKGRSASLTS